MDSNKNEENRAPESGGCLPQEWPFVSLLLLNWNGRPLLEMCLPPLMKLDYPNYEVVLVDNASTDDSLPFTRERFPEVKIIANKDNLGFSSGMNAALRQIQSDVVVLLNNDVVVRRQWLKALIRPLVVDDTIGITGCKLLYPDEQTIQHAGARLSYPLAYTHHHHYQETDTGQDNEVREVEYVTGAAMAIAGRVLDDVGLLDESFSPFYYEEVDFCYRARAAGYRTVYVPQAVAIHHESTSMRQINTPHLQIFHKSRLRFVLKHYTRQQFFEDFLPAEAEQLKNPALLDDLLRMQRIYLEITLALPEILRSRDESKQLGQFLTALTQLRQVALSQYASIHLPEPKGQPQKELAERQTIREPEFTSDKPLIGPLLAAFRRTWNSVSTKWYVRAVIKQQMAFNRLLPHLLDDQDRQGKANASDVSLLAEELVAMQRRFEEATAEMQRDLDRLHSRLDRIEQMVEQGQNNLDRGPGKTESGERHTGERHS